MTASEPIRIESMSEADTIGVGARLAGRLKPGDVIALEGDLGAGKTRFVRGLARGLGHDERRVSSPTYVLVHEYDDAEGAPPLIHVDAYRVASADELEGFGLDRAMADGAVLVVEWASRLGDALDPSRLRVEIAHAGDDLREISLSWATEGGEWAERLRSL